MKKGLIKLVPWVVLPSALILVIITAGITLWIYKLVQEIPDDRVIKDFSHKAVTLIYDKDGHLLSSLREDKSQIGVPLTEISKALQKAVIASEDPYFLKHSGIDYRQTWESIKDNLRVWRLVRGGSTITQQVAKNLFLTGEKTFSRKIKEYFLAKRIEALLPKERIIEMYLNEVGWGYGIYGAELASRFYLDKHAADLNIAEGAFLAAMLRNPAYYNPYKRLDVVLKRQQLVLRLMLGHNLITRDEYDEALSSSIELRQDKRNKRFIHIGLDREDDVEDILPCYARLVEGYLVQTVGRNLLYDVGLEVRTTLDDKIQNKVEEAIKEVENENPLSLRERDRVRVGGFSNETHTSLRLTKEDENNPPIPPLEKGGKGGFERPFSGEIKIGFLIEDGDKVRAIGCTDMWEEAVERIKRLGPPFGSYRYEVKTDEDIVWKDILLIDTGDRLL